MYPSIHASIHLFIHHPLTNYLVKSLHPYSHLLLRTLHYLCIFPTIWLRHRRSTCDIHNISISIRTLDVALIKAKQLYLITVYQQHHFLNRKMYRRLAFAAVSGLMRRVDQQTMVEILPHAHASEGRHNQKHRSPVPIMVQRLPSFYLRSSKADLIWWRVERCAKKRLQQGFYKHIKGVWSRQQGPYRRQKAAASDAGKRNSSFEWKPDSLIYHHIKTAPWNVFSWFSAQ